MPWYWISAPAKGLAPASPSVEQAAAAACCSPCHPDDKQTENIASFTYVIRTYRCVVTSRPPFAGTLSRNFGRLRRLHLSSVPSCSAAAAVPSVRSINVIFRIVDRAMRLLSRRRRLLIVASCIGIRASTGAAEATDTAPATGAESPSSDLGFLHVQKSCDIQLFNILNPSEENAAMNDNLYLQDLVQYNEDPLAFLTSRVEPNFLPTGSQVPVAPFFAAK